MILWAASFLVVCSPSAALHDPAMRILSTALAREALLQPDGWGVTQLSSSFHPMLLSEGTGKGKEEGRSMRTAQILV